jgi:hypothetical protein
VYSGDQGNQLKDYVANAGNPFVVYLTPYGQKPSGYSIPQEKLQDLEKHHRFTCLSYEKDILDWLGRLETKVNEDVLRAAIIQYTDTVKGITNQKKEFNMKQEIAKELYEKYGELSREDLIKKLVDDGYARVKEGRLFLSEKGFYVSNSILTELI